MLVSPTEPPALKAIGTVSSLPETKGADVMWAVQGGWVGVQRKEVHDLLASVADGRLAFQLGQMHQLHLGVFMVEGKIKWTTDGSMAEQYAQHWTRCAWRGLLWSIRRHGVMVECTDSLQDTIEAIHALEQWAQKRNHSSTTRRPGPQSPWGTADNREFGIHLLQGLSGIGPEMAAVIYDTFDGVPWKWDVTREELLAIKGMGRKKVDSIMAAIGRKDKT